MLNCTKATSQAVRLSFFAARNARWEKLQLHPIILWWVITIHCSVGHTSLGIEIW